MHLRQSRPRWLLPAVAAGRIFFTTCFITGLLGLIVRMPILILVLVAFGCSVAGEVLYGLFFGYGGRRS